MDSMITAAAIALAKGDALGALNRVALRDDAPALALRGIAMAQLGDLGRARNLLRRAARAFGTKQAVARARCLVAEAEIALVTRELQATDKTLSGARQTLEAQGDRVNAAYARHLEVRRLLLLGQLDAAEHALQMLDASVFAPAFKAAYELVVADVAMRRMRIAAAREALDRAAAAARQAQIPALIAEVERACDLLNRPAARLIRRGTQRLILLEDVAALQTSSALLVDACRYVIRQGQVAVSLASRPLLFDLAQALAEAWPEDVSRDALIARAFRLKTVDETHRARLRVEMGRLRKLLKAVAGVNASSHGFRLEPRLADEVLVLTRPINEKHAAVLALLADGEAWSSSALALALGVSQRTLQRALEALAEAGKVQAYGQGRARRWLTPPVPDFTTTLLLPGPWPGH